MSSVPTAAEIFRLSVESMKSSDSFSYVLETIVSVDDSGLPVVSFLISGTFLAPDRERTRVTFRVGGLSMELEFISIGEDFYVRDPLTGAWSIQPVNPRMCMIRRTSSWTRGLLVRRRWWGWPTWMGVPSIISGEAPWWTFLGIIPALSGWRRRSWCRCTSGKEARERRFSNVVGRSWTYPMLTGGPVLPYPRRSLSPSMGTAGWWSLRCRRLRCRRLGPGRLRPRRLCPGRLRPMRVILPL